MAIRYVNEGTFFKSTLLHSTKFVGISGACFFWDTQYKVFESETFCRIEFVEVDTGTVPMATYALCSCPSKVAIYFIVAPLKLLILIGIKSGNQVFIM